MPGSARANDALRGEGRAPETVIRQGDVFWVRFTSAGGSEPWGRRPALVLRHDRFNRTQLNTVVAAVTTDPRHASFRGNVRLRRSEVDLGQPSVVNMTQIQTLAVSGLARRTNTLSAIPRGAVRRADGGAFTPRRENGPPVSAGAVIRFL